jgi:hypothetical protein
VFCRKTPPLTNGSSKPPTVRLRRQDFHAIGGVSAGCELLVVADEGAICKSARPGEEASDGGFARGLRGAQGTCRRLLISFSKTAASVAPMCLA